MMTIQRSQESGARSQESELCRVVIETILCCLLGVLFGVAMYWGWAREVRSSVPEFHIQKSVVSTP
jgi:hypothetical protein